MSEIRWRTAKGTECVARIVRERQVNADGYKMMVPCYEGRLVAGSLPLPLDGGEWIEHPEVGTALKFSGRVVVPVPAEVAAELRALIAEFSATIAEQQAQADAVAAKYSAHREMMRRVMGY